MHWRRLGLAALAVPAAFVTIAATPSPSPIVLPPDPACIATICTASPTPTSSVLSAGTGPSTPATGDGGPVVALLALPLIGIGAGAASWALSRRNRR